MFNIFFSLSCASLLHKFNEDKIATSNYYSQRKIKNQILLLRVPLCKIENHGYKNPMQIAIHGYLSVCSGYREFCRIEQHTQLLKDFQKSDKILCVEILFLRHSWLPLSVKKRRFFLNPCS